MTAHDHSAHALGDGRGALVPADWVAAGLIVLAVAAIVGVALGRRRPSLVIATAAVGAGFQLGHLVEHLAQTGYWIGHRAKPPWMTPWAEALAASYQSVTAGVPGLGMELLHLVGNVIFLTAALAIAMLAGSLAGPGPRRLARLGARVQLVHVAEHVALTVTLAVAGRPIGVSTVFGVLDAGPVLWSYRIWWHLTINLAATALLAAAVAGHAWSESRRRIASAAVPGGRHDVANPTTA